MIFKVKDKKDATSVLARHPAHDGRDRLRFFAAELVKAKAAVEELEARIGRLVGISVALSSSGAYDGEIRMSEIPVNVPRFNLPSTRRS
ncbi:hypothetical protein [Bradyrhizobium sp. 76]|uniref:hypothetical protein n=1 Tax=Bradyrhizobium sp. 76 TaxID=2782680 RepID=UPI001FF99AFF|nr:hypothetical protein [Bradyrhizobium sp. 76]MCK1409544.1 hypothetical protein [Bradyrhizobium sp. 76]